MPFNAKGSHLISSYNPRDFFSTLPRAEEAAKGNGQEKAGAEAGKAAEEK